MDAAPASTTAARAWTFLARVAAATATSWHMHRTCRDPSRAWRLRRELKWYRRFSSSFGARRAGAVVSERVGRRSACTVRTWGRRRRRCARRRRRGRRGRAPGIERACARAEGNSRRGARGPRADGLFGGGVVHPAVEPGDGGAAEPRGDGGGDEVARESGRRRGNIARGRRVRGEVARGARVRERRENERASGLGAAAPGVPGETLRRKTADSASEHARRGVRDDGSGDKRVVSAGARARVGVGARRASGATAPATRFSRENAADESALFATSKTTTEGCPPAIVSSERRKSEEPDEASEAASEDARFVRSKKSRRRAARSFFARTFVMMRAM